MQRTVAIQSHKLIYTCLYRFSSIFHCPSKSLANHAFSLYQPLSRATTFCNQPSTCCCIIHACNSSQAYSAHSNCSRSLASSLFLNLYHSPSTAVHYGTLLNYVPGVWETILQALTTVFEGLEGLSTLLVVQALGQVSRFLIEERNESFQFVFLVGAAA